MKELSWKPVRRGDKYCSPACGYGCSYKAFTDACTLAKVLLNGMYTQGWEIDVWENMGWFYALRHPKLEIGIHATHGERTEYFLSGLTALVGQIPHMKDPNHLVSALMKHMRHESNRIHDALLTLQGNKK